MLRTKKWFDYLFWQPSIHRDGEGEISGSEDSKATEHCRLTLIHEPGSSLLVAETQGREKGPTHHIGPHKGATAGWEAGFAVPGGCRCCRVLAEGCDWFVWIIPQTDRGGKPVGLKTPQGEAGLADGGTNPEGSLSCWVTVHTQREQGTHRTLEAQRCQAVFELWGLTIHY